MTEESEVSVLDPHLPRTLREQLEESLWHPIEDQATLEVILQDPDFLAAPGLHPAMFADHGVVHVRDVATRLVRLTETLNGLFLPTRTPQQVALMQTLGVAMAYIHDAGMVDMTHVGRKTHALYAVHLAFTPDVDALVAHVRSAGAVGWRLEAVERADPFGIPLDTVVREILSLAVAHSKSTVPSDVLADPTELRKCLRRIIFTSMADHRAAAGADPEDDLGRLTATEGVSHPAAARAYSWLAARSGPRADLAHDVIDAVRVLRVADVLRQRGTSLKTSAGFEVFFDARTGRAVCTLRPADGRSAYLVTYDDQRGAGEANISMATLTHRGDLRFAFHRGSFLGDQATLRAAESVAEVILDVWADVAPAFEQVRARGLPAPARDAADLMVLLERPSDEPRFADLVAQVVRASRPEQAEAVAVVHDLESASPLERQRYEHGRPIDPGGRWAASILQRVSEHGSDTSHLDSSAAFRELRSARVAAGEVLVEAGSFPAFVYIPLGPGLTVHLTGGYPSVELHAWVPLGLTGAVRRSPRNGEIIADREVEVLMIPSEEFVTEWLRPLQAHQLADLLARRA